MFNNEKPNRQFFPDATRHVRSLEDQRALLERIKSDKAQFEFTDMGVNLNSPRFFNVKIKGSTAQLAKIPEVAPSNESPGL